MPDIHLTEEQLERLEAVRADVEAAYVGPYGRVTTAGAIDYLLDTYTPPSDREGEPTAALARAPTADTAEGAATDSDTTDDGDEAATATASAAASNGSGSSKSGSGGGGSPLAAAAALLEQNDDVWRKSGGDAPYEVDLPDGTTEAVRTKGDVKRLLFKHYR